jgi:hypothetical protein
VLSWPCKGSQKLHNYTANLLFLSLINSLCYDNLDVFKLFHNKGVD